MRTNEISIQSITITHTPPPHLLAAVRYRSSESAEITFRFEQSYPSPSGVQDQDAYG
ncbi:unnamed protein product [Linum tenue]|uniref:Uncharacterized protein n=1 Tax=Linum tenue TaxID=586396 RepID=A0AAV0HVM9_9ROSI|nr:unnamed protein product [Linum tenue]